MKWDDVNIYLLRRVRRVRREIKMNKTIALSIFTFLTLCLSAQKALADERWTTEQYDVVYEEDRNETAIWSYGDNGGTIFIDGLAGVYQDRESYSGYWVQNSSSVRCDTYREGANGEPTYYWGRFDIAFLDPDFPSRWEARLGLCDRAPTIPLTGTPITSNPTRDTQLDQTPQPVRGLY